MIDLEATLREHLERRAAAIQIHPDIDAVIDDNTLITVDAKSASRPGRRIWLTLAAAVLVALFAVGMLALDRERSTPSDQPRDLSRRPLANGVIVVGRSEAEGLVAVDPDSAGRIGRAPVRRGEWSPDGSRLAYVLGKTVSVFDTVTRSTMEIGSCKTPSFMGDSCSLAWSNDGRTVATTTSSGIRLYDAVSPSSEPIASLSVDGVPDHVNWTADDRLVFTVTQVSANGTKIDMMDIDGTNERTIADTRAEGFGFQYWSLDLSPDGRTLVWLDGVNGTDPNAQMLVKLMMMDVDDARPRMVRDVGHCYCLGLSPAVTWSPDGGRLALVLVGAGFKSGVSGPYVDQGLDLGPNGGLAVVDSDGRNGRYLGPAIGVPTWQPLPP